MRGQLAKYVELLFAGTTGTYEIQQEIMQNTLDKYDDLVAQGKTPEAAYRLAISGIGDINEIIGQEAPTTSEIPLTQPENTSSSHKLLRAIAIGLYILCAVPLFLADDSTLGLCITLVIVAAATAIMVYIGKEKSKTLSANYQNVPAEYPPSGGNGYNIARGIIWGGGISLYVAVSLITRAWWITWMIFPILACIQGVITGIFELKEACKK